MTLISKFGSPTIPIVIEPPSGRVVPEGSGAGAVGWSGRAVAEGNVAEGSGSGVAVESDVGICTGAQAVSIRKAQAAARRISMA